MNPKKIMTLMVSIMIHTLVYAEEQRCGLIFPNNASLMIQLNKGCEISITPNYANLSYFTFYDNTGIDSLLSDETFFAKFGEKNYFLSEEVDGPRLTVRVLTQEEARSIHTSEMHGFLGRSILFVQILPKAARNSESSFSGKVSCLTVAEGNEQMSFKARFCSPISNNGKKQMARFESILNKIVVSGSKP